MSQKKEDYSEENIANAEEIRRKIHEGTDDETKEILTRAKTLAQNILSDARHQAEKTKEDALSELEKKINLIKERIFSALNLEKKRIIMGEKSNFIEEVFSELANQAVSFRNQKDYPQFLEKTIVEATDVVDTANLEVFYSPLDEKLLNDSFIKKVKDSCRNKMNQEVTLKFTKSNFNDIGFMVQSLDGRLIYDARFTSRLNLMRDNIYMDLLRKL
ncbi:MAG: V-type ATP synthase subunit E [Candidatus Omnitrophica bacterium]|nr:V-type ATP synthase subunit E [Candidatus Omnitrophota bacterium]